MADKDDKEMNDAAKADAARADAQKRMDETLDTMLKGVKDACDRMDGLGKRMDAWEEAEEKKKADAVKADAARKDEEDKEEAEKAEKLAADKSRKDAEDCEKEKMDAAAKADAARADASSDLKAIIADQAKRLEELSALVRQPIPESHRSELLSLQSRADGIMSQMGERAPQPMVGEDPATYDRRLANTLKGKSKTWGKVDLYRLDDTSFSVAKDQIYADALVMARNPTDLQPGKMREIISRTPGGHTVVTFAGGADTHFVKQFARPARRVQWINDGRQAAV